MKKYVSILIAVLLLLILCACGEPAETPTQPQTQATEPSQTESQPADSTDASTETTAADLKALAESCIGKSVEDLYALIGEPESAEYAPSCMGDGKDGNLDYGDFVVYTYREGEEEVVNHVE